MRELSSNIFRFLFLVFLQLFVLNNIQLSGFINPYLYVLFILMLPFEVSGWVTLILAFILGFTIDVCSSTLGYHTIATVFMAFLRFYLLRLISPHEGYESGMKPNLHSLGFSWFFKYASILTLAHHLILFWVESFSMDDLFSATIRALASAVFSILLIFLYQFLSLRHKN